MPDETWGEHVKASVVLMPGSRLTAEALRQYCRAHMPTFRAPKEIEIVPELPKGATGKVLTAVLRAQCPGELTRASCRPCPSGARRQLLFFGEISVVKRLTVCYCEITNNQTPHSGTREYFRR